jgi:hypothetical protein
LKNWYHAAVLATGKQLWPEINSAE